MHPRDHRGDARSFRSGRRAAAAGRSGGASRPKKGPAGRGKELLGFQVGTGESAQSWRVLLVDIKARGLAIASEVSVGDGALGFWKAVDEVFPGTRHQRRWFHKVSNVLNKFPNSMGPAVKSDLQNINHAGTKAAALVAVEVFRQK